VNLRPLTVARYGVWFALAVAFLSGWLGVRSGASMDYVMLRGVFVFIIFVALAFGAEAILTLGFRPPAASQQDDNGQEAHDQA
jgi:hypothetical protein